MSYDLKDFFRETFWDWPYWIFKSIFDENDLIVLILSVHAKKLVPPVHFDFDVSWISLIFKPLVRAGHNKLVFSRQCRDYFPINTCGCHLNMQNANHLLKYFLRSRIRIQKNCFWLLFELTIFLTECNKHSILGWYCITYENIKKTSSDYQYLEWL